MAAVSSYSSLGNKCLTTKGTKFGYFNITAHCAICCCLVQYVAMCSYVVHDFALRQQGRSTATNINFGQQLNNKNTKIRAIGQQKREEKML